jgi:peroxiredoxin
MVKKFFACLALVFLLAGTGGAQVTVGEPAQDFTLTDVNGQSHSLSDFKGKYVVLEWFNYDCPFVKKHYGSNNMQSLQKEFTGQGVIWLAINSSAPGKQGHYEAPQMAALAQERGVSATGILLDPDGTVGRQYGAKTTPHMFIIDPDGVLIYQGAIDSSPGMDPAEISGAQNYVRAALTEAMAGEPVSQPFTQSYGCSVKY